MGRKLFITGTGTDVGKTYVTALIAKKLQDAGLKVAYYKAAMSGNARRPDGTLIPGDAVAVKETARLRQELAEMCPYVYENAFSPHLAAQVEGGPVSMEVVKKGFGTLADRYDYVVMEGSGGIVCPLRAGGKVLLLEDVIRELEMSCLIVANSGLGAINSVALTVFYLRSRNIPVKGIIFNRFHSGDPIEEDNLRMCELLTGVRTAACVQDGALELPLDAASLASLFD